MAATPGFLPFTSDPLTLRTYDLFFTTIRLFLEHGVTHVAEAAFQHPAWARGLAPLRSLAALRIVRRHVAEVARIRAEQRAREQPSRAAHDDIGHFAIDQLRAADTRCTNVGSGTPRTSTPPRSKLWSPSPVRRSILIAGGLRGTTPAGMTPKGPQPGG